ncbi:MAG: inositol-3-phosphate synthase [Candidatus Verstraetearchaeota archaeon]|nr:inositol-3-phosphate synthase [Candidatus Verstraetearchaeota archaeon]
MGIKVAIVGVGNCASALVQGVFYYRNAKENEEIPGILHPRLGNYHIRDIEFVAAFDVDANKVGKDLSEAIFSKPNNTRKFCEVPKLNVKVKRGPLLDGIGKYLKNVINISQEEVVDIAEELRNSGAEILVNYLPVGSEKATRFYAEQAIKAKCAFVNCMPVFIASDLEWQRKFFENGLPVAGDDVMSQIGATVLHKTIAKLLVDRGVKILESYQLNIGGDTDFLNMLEEERLVSKRISKTSAVQAMIPYNIPLRIGPSDYVPFLENKKICYIYIKGEYFGSTPVQIDVKLDVWDAPNSAGVVIDVIRACKIALDRGIAGPLISVSAFAFKHPPEQMPYELAKRAFEEFIEGKRER